MDNKLLSIIIYLLIILQFFKLSIQNYKLNDYSYSNYYNITKFVNKKDILNITNKYFLPIFVETIEYSIN